MLIRLILLCLFFITALTAEERPTPEDVIKKLENTRAQRRFDRSGGAVQNTSQVQTVAQAPQDELTALIASEAAVVQNPHTWLLAIAIEKYDNTSPVVYSAKSGDAFVAAAQKTFGIPKENIVFLRDDKATTGAVKDAVLKISERAEPGDTIYFYYSGHGIPDPASNEAFILPKDKSVEYVGKEPDLKLRHIYQTLEKSKAAKVVAIVDACFSGMTDGEAVYKGVAAGYYKPKAYVPTAKMVILTAGKDTQFSNSFDAKKHRMFSYYLIKSMLEGRKDMVDIYQDVRLKVKDESRKKGGNYEQEPQMIGNGKLKL
jgi:hypothetical protein